MQYEAKSEFSTYFGAELFYGFCHNIRRHYTAFNNLLFFKCQGFFDIKVIPSFIPLTAERRLSPRSCKC